MHTHTVCIALKRSGHDEQQTDHAFWQLAILMGQVIRDMLYDLLMQVNLLWDKLSLQALF